jgi:hypothetical protein
MFSFENDPDIEAASNACEFPRDTFHIGIMTMPWYMYLKKDICFSWLRYGVNGFLWVFMKHQIVSYVLNFRVEILLFLTCDLGLTDQIMNDFPFHVMWVVELEVEVMTCMSMTPLHDRNIQEWIGIVSFNFHCEFDGRSNTVEMVKKLLQPF